MRRLAPSRGGPPSVPSKPAPPRAPCPTRTASKARSAASSSVRLGITARHAAHRVGAAAVAGLDQQLGVGAHERHGHRHLRAVGQHELGPLPEALDRAEDVVPAAGVQPRGVVAQLVQDLVHLERRGQRLDQHGGPDRAAVEPERVLGERERVVPQPRLQVRLQLGQVEERAGAALQQRLARCGTRTARSRSGRPPPARRPRQRGAPAGATRAGARAAWRVSSFRRYSLAVGLRRTRACRARRRPGSPGRRPCSAQVGELASSKSAMNPRAPEFSALITILRSVGPVISTRRSCKRGRAGRDLSSRPRGSRRLGEEVERAARVQLGLALLAPLQQLAPGAVELAVQRRHQGQAASLSTCSSPGGGVAESCSAALIASLSSSGPAAPSGCSTASSRPSSRVCAAICSAQPGLAATTASAPVASRFPALRRPSSAAGSGLTRL